MRLPKNSTKQDISEEMMMTPGAGTITLNNEVSIPRLGLGTYEADQGGEVEQAVAWALDCGYRSIDTASAYGNETGVGRGMMHSLVPRDRLFVTSKVWNSEQGYEQTLEAWSPLMKGRVTDIPELQEIAAHHNKTPAQVALRWELQSELVAIPKSVRRNHIEDNRDIFDFELTGNEMQTIASLDRGERIGPHPDEFAM